MPKTAPDTVISYRIELQESERQIVRDWVAGQNAAILTKSVDDLLTVENLFVGATILELITGEEILFGTFNDLGDVAGIVGDLKDWWQKRQAKRKDDKESVESMWEQAKEGTFPYGVGAAADRGDAPNETDILVSQITWFISTLLRRF